MTTLPDSRTVLIAFDNHDFVDCMVALPGDPNPSRAEAVLRAEAVFDDDDDDVPTPRIAMVFNNTTDCIEYWQTKTRNSFYDQADEIGDN